MKTIWLVNPYGPIDGENWREYSFNQFGKYLSNNGFKVIWWTANFSHHFKDYRSESWQDNIINENYIIRLVPTSSYRRNLSLGRFRKDILFGKNALARFAQEEKPDIIIASENPMCMGKPGFEYAQKYNIPIIYDQMDIWPEFLIRLLPAPLSAIMNFTMGPVYKKRRKIYESIDGAIALGKHYLEFMFDVCPSLQKKPNALIYNGIDVEEFRKHLKDPISNVKIPLSKKEDEIWCIFAGTLGPSYDIQGIIDCAEYFDIHNAGRYKFIIAGSGPQEELVKEAETKIHNIIYVGKLLPSDLIPIYGRCDIGLSTYSTGSNVDMCDKFYDYTAAGLAIVNSLMGEISEHIKNENIGLNYIANDSNSLIAALKQLDDKLTLDNIKKKSKLVGEDFDMNKQNKKLIAVIESVLGGSTFAAGQE